VIKSTRSFTGALLTVPDLPYKTGEFKEDRLNFPFIGLQLKPFLATVVLYGDRIAHEIRQSAPGLSTPKKQPALPA